MPAFLEAKRNFEKACRQIAIVNLKKTAGDNTSQRSQITQYARRDRLFLEEQLSLLNPNVVVCCGRSLVYTLAKEIFDDARDARLIAERPAGRVFHGQSIAWIDYVHPQA